MWRASFAGLLVACGGGADVKPDAAAPMVAAGVPTKLSLGGTAITADGASLTVTDSQPIPVEVTIDLRTFSLPMSSAYVDMPTIVVN